MLADAVERLVERCETLLAIEHQKRVLLAIQTGRTLELAGGEDALGVTHAQNAACRIVVRD